MKLSELLFGVAIAIILPLVTIFGTLVCLGSFNIFFKQLLCRHEWKILIPGNLMLHPGGATHVTQVKCAHCLKTKKI